MNKVTPGRGLLPLTESAFAELWDREFKEFARRQEEIDQRMYDALCGKPFWGTRPAGGKITGLTEYLPKRKR